MEYHYNFDHPASRLGTDSFKWDVKENELPMWVADMDFEAPPEILDALRARLDHGIFGYPKLTDNWYQSYIDWWRNRHGLTIEKDWLLFSGGIVGTVASLIRRLTAPGENVLLMTPAYNAFLYIIAENGRNIAENRLIYDGNDYSIDWEDLDKKLADPNTNLFLLCNPHNPIGRIWDRETLSRIGAMCKRHSVIVISDEIHCDLTEPGKRYVPFATVDETCREISLTCLAPTKAFNLAGIHTSASFSSNPVLRAKAASAFSLDGISSPNVFSVPATVAAFTKGERWLDEACAYIWENRRMIRDFLAKELPMIHFVPGEATYLLWVDVSAVTDNVEDFCKRLRAETGLFVTPGTAYGKPTGEGFFRWNLACPHAYVQDALGRLKQFVTAHS
ncbi:MAG: pyridoxal phosphate-dependent aminotransferase [Oscillospiraceae bacterium]|nr:pyridoxal phosphate-dependent aminotransferase [Oscillospiraceae bacterium]